MKMTESKREINNYSFKFRKLPGRTRRIDGKKFLGKKEQKKGD